MSNGSYLFGRYEYTETYEWHWERKVRVFRYPQDFYRKPDDPRPFVTFKVRTSRRVYKVRAYLDEMRFLDG